MLSSQDEQSFLAALAAAGQSSAKPLNLVATGKVHRYRVTGEKSNKASGWYVLFDNGGLVAGAFGDWRVNVTHTWCSRSEQNFTAEEKAAFQVKMQEAKAARDAELHNVQMAARQKAAHLLSIAGNAANDHPYLINKGVKSFGLKRLRNMLVIPIRSANGSLISMQFIQSDGSKRFLTGGEVKAGYYAIGKPDKVVLVCEGYATGASLFEATGYAVAVAFNAGNLLAVAEVMRNKFPALTIIVCADNDVSTEGNPGLNKAEGAAGQIGGLLAVPRFQDHERLNGKVPTDYNDLHLLHGLSAVKASVDQAMSASAHSTGQAVGVTLDRKAFVDLIEVTDDFDVLTGDLVQQIVRSGLAKPAKEYLLALIAKKAGVPKASLFEAAKSGPASGGAEDDNAALVRELNEKHAVVAMGGQVLIVNRDYDPVLERPLLTFSSKSHFELRYCNRKVWAQGEQKGLGSYWLEHPQRAEYQGIAFSPDREEPGFLNLWQGWGVEAKPGDCDKFIDFLEVAVCGGNRELYDYVLRWCAHLVQKPRELPGTALVLRGREGIGKNTFVDALGELIGLSHFVPVTSFGQIIGRFSGHLANALLVHCNESIWGGDKSAQGILKSFITDGTQTIEFKGKEPIIVKSFRRHVFSTNESWAVPRGEDDRRYVIIDMGDKYKGDYAYFAAIKEELANGGFSALMHYLRNVDITDWNPRLIPQSLSERGWDLKIQSGNSVVKWWFDMLQRGWVTKSADAYSDGNQFVWLTACLTEDVQHAYLKWCTDYRITHPEHSVNVGKDLHKWGIDRVQKRMDGGRHWVYRMPDLQAARAAFSKRFSIPPTYWQDEQDVNVI
jgi:putative DNA primase/helicase